jgi:hypothetical protein
LFNGTLPTEYTRIVPLYSAGYQNEYEFSFSHPKRASWELFREEICAKITRKKGQNSELLYSKMMAVKLNELYQSNLL